MPGGTVEVHYVGVDYDTGEEFDSSWGRGESIEFPLQGLIQGWQDGIPGMKVGGRRQLIIPPAQAYGPAGSGHQLSGKTLIFVIDLLSTRYEEGGPNDGFRRSTEATKWRRTSKFYRRPPGLAWLIGLVVIPLLLA